MPPMKNQVNPAAKQALADYRAERQWFLDNAPPDLRAQFDEGTIRHHEMREEMEKRGYIFQR